MPHTQKLFSSPRWQVARMPGAVQEEKSQQMSHRNPWTNELPSSQQWYLLTPPPLKQTRYPLFFQQHAWRRHAGLSLCHSCWEARHRKPSCHSTVPVKVQGFFELPRTGVWHGGRRSVFSRTGLHFSSPWQLSSVYKHSQTFLVWNTAKIQSRESWHDITSRKFHTGQRCLVHSTIENTAYVTSRLCVLGVYKS